MFFDNFYKYNSSASQWLSGEQVILCSGHPKVYFGTIVEGSCGGWGGVHGRSSGSLTNVAGGGGGGISILAQWWPQEARYTITWPTLQ